MTEDKRPRNSGRGHVSVSAKAYAMLKAESARTGTPIAQILERLITEDLAKRTT